MDYRITTAGDEIAILPSLLAADFACLGHEASRAEKAGADALHIDIMDGHFVPNLSMGPDVVAMAKRTVNVPLSVHLMLANPEKHIEKFIRAGADVLLIHAEVEGDISGMLRQIRALGARPGITINPGTPVEVLWPYLGDIDEVLFMSVNPGYGGQKFIESVLPKVRVIREVIQTRSLAVDISIDGGIGLETVTPAATAGCNVFIAGTSLYRSVDMAKTVHEMRVRAINAFRKVRE